MKILNRSKAILVAALLSGMIANVFATAAQANGELGVWSMQLCGGSDSDGGCVNLQNRSFYDTGAIDTRVNGFESRWKDLNQLTKYTSSRVNDLNVSLAELRGEVNNLNVLNANLNQLKTDYTKLNADYSAKVAQNENLRNSLVDNVQKELKQFEARVIKDNDRESLREEIRQMIREEIAKQLQ